MTFRVIKRSNLLCWNVAVNFISYDDTLTIHADILTFNFICWYFFNIYWYFFIIIYVVIKCWYFNITCWCMYSIKLEDIVKKVQNSCQGTRQFKHASIMFFFLYKHRNFRTYWLHVKTYIAKIGLCQSGEIGFWREWGHGHFHYIRWNLRSSKIFLCQTTPEFPDC